MTYVFLQCVNEACRFRFPAPAGETAALVCPRCRSSLTFVAEAERCAAGATQQRGGRPEVVGLLDNIRSIHNVGSIFRSADGAGVAHLHLAGITATPDHPRLAKAALGAHETVCWTYHTNALDAAQALRAQGYRLLALEPAVANSAPFAPRPADRLALIVGNERAASIRAFWPCATPSLACPCPAAKRRSTPPWPSELGYTISATEKN